MNLSARFQFFFNLLPRRRKATFAVSRFAGVGAFILSLSLAGCQTPPEYSRFVEIDENGWTRMAAIEYIPAEEDSNFVAPQDNVALMLTLRHDRNTSSPLLLEISRSDSGIRELTDTIAVNLGQHDAATNQGNGSYGLTITQICLDPSVKISQDFRLSVTPVDTVVGLHSIGLSIITPDDSRSLP